MPNFRKRPIVIRAEQFDLNMNASEIVLAGITK